MAKFILYLVIAQKKVLPRKKPVNSEVMAGL
jgi:hypothetical protein